VTAVTGNARRVACLLAPELPVAAALRARPELAGRPLVIASEPGPRGTVLAAAPAAARAGVRAGDALAHARARCAELCVRVASPALERAARAALLDAALSASPRAALAPPRAAGPRAGEAIVHIDASGSGRLFASEAALAGALVARAAALGVPAAAALAGSRLAAELAARDAARHGGPGATRILAPGADAAFLAPLPLDLLDLDDALAGTLTRFGLRRTGELLALPAAALATRLGPAAAALVAALRGEGEEPPIPAPRETRLEEAVDLDAPLDRLEPLAFVLRGLLSRLLGRLAARHLACAELELTLQLAAGAPGREGLPSTGRGARDVRRLRLAAPASEPRPWLRRLQTALEVDPPAAAIEGCALAAEGVPARRDQLDLFRPAGPAPAALDELLAELEALCGPERIGAPQVPDDPRPGAWGLAAFGTPPPAGQEGPARNALPVLAVRALRPPLPAEVRVRAGRPAWVRSALAHGDVVHCAGPWRATGGWWSAERRFAFDSFDVATSDGLLVRLRYDRTRRTWEIDALYD
jgi:protein ImuB